jgi:hypothetical protein
MQNSRMHNGLMACAPDPGLQFVKMSGIHFWSNEMRFIVLVLSKATVLRRMWTDATILFKV